MAEGSSGEWIFVLLVWDLAGFALGPVGPSWCFSGLKGLCLSGFCAWAPFGVEMPLGCGDFTQVMKWVCNFRWCPAMLHTVAINKNLWKIQDTKSCLKKQDKNPSLSLGEPLGMLKTKYL